MTPLNTKRMTLDDLKNRLRERIELLSERLQHLSPEVDGKRYKNTKDERSTAIRRLRALDEKVSQGISRE